MITVDLPSLARLRLRSVDDKAYFSVLLGEPVKTGNRYEMETVSTGHSFVWNGLRLTRRSQRPAVLILISHLQSQESVLALLHGSVCGDRRRTEVEVCGCWPLSDI